MTTHLAIARRPPVIRVLATLVLLLAGGCGGSLRVGVPTTLPPRALSITEEDGTRCIRARPGVHSPYREQLPLAEDDPALVPYLADLPANVRRTAVAAGLEPLIARLLRAHAESDGEPTLATLAVRQQLAERIAALQPQMLSVEFECECVGALLARTLAEHDDSASDHQIAMTVASLVAGAGFSLAAGAWDLANNHATRPRSPDGPLITAITGAVVTTGFGAVAMIPRARPVVIEHDHNLLAPIVNASDPEGLYPTFVFRMLTLPTTSGEPTPRERIVARWDELLRAEVAAEDRATAESLLYGGGGVYDDQLTRLRHAMIEELETTLDSLSREVDELSREIARSLER